MRRKQLIAITVITDDETGIDDIGDLDYSIDHFALMDYLRNGDLYKNKKELFAFLGVLACEVKKYSDDVAKGKI